MDLVLVGLFALWLGRNMDFDFSQNPPITPELPPELPPENVPYRLTEWSLVREQNDRFGTPCSLWKRQYKQGDTVLFEQFQIRKNNEVFRSGYRDEGEAFAEFEKTVRPFREGELEDLEERAREKEEEMNPTPEEPKEREPTPLYSDMNKGGSRNGSF